MPQRAGIQSMSRGLRRAAHSIDLQSSDVSWRGFTASQRRGLPVSAGIRNRSGATIGPAPAENTRRGKGDRQEIDGARGEQDLRAASFEGQNLSQNVALTVSARCFASGDPQVES